MKARGFEDVNFSLDTRQIKSPVWMKKDIKLKKSAVDAPDVSFFYEIDSYKLNNQQIKYLKKLVKQKKPKGILIRSSADSAGSEEYNIRLSRNRAEYIQNKLKSFGIPITIELDILGEKNSTGPDPAIFRRSEIYLRRR
jgi:outer membrane protein OmpA-like peptidoglycan-associated protein